MDMKTNNDMKMAVFLSVLFHIGVFITATVGLPHFAKEFEPLEIAITVELADLDETSKADKPPTKPKPVYNKAETAPDLLSPKEIEPPKEADIPMPPKEEGKPKIDKKIIKKPPKPQNKPRAPKKPKTETVEDEKPKDKKDFTSLLKSLTPDEPEQTPAPNNNAEDKDKVSQIVDFSKQMTSSELGELNRGVEPCWNVNAGGRDAHNLIVELMVFVNQDRSVRDVQIIDQSLYNSNTHFRAAAEAARRALLNPRCSTLNLPPEKYDRWKKFKYIFNPSSML